MQRLFVLCLSLALVFSLSACTPTQEDAPEDTSTPEVTEPADTSEPEQTAPAEPDDQEPQETAETTADTEPTEIPSQETPTAETPPPEPVQQSSQEQQETPVIPSDGGGNPDSSAGNDAGQSTGNQGGSGNTGGNSGSVTPGNQGSSSQGGSSSGEQTTPPTDSGNQGGQSSSGSSGSAWDSPEQKEEWIQKVEDAGGYYNGAGGVYLPYHLNKSIIHFKGDDPCHLPSPSYLAHLCTIGARGAPSASSKYIQLEAPGLGASFFVLKFVYFSDIDTV